MARGVSIRWINFSLQKNAPFERNGAFFIESDRLGGSQHSG